MTVKSMTGFGRGESEKSGRVWTTEIRCVNNRFLDVKIKLPRGYTALEERIRKKVADYHQRGRVDLVLNVQGDFSDLQKLSVNAALAASYRETLAQMAKELKIKDDTTLSQLASYPDVLVREQQSEDLESVWVVIEQAVTEALQGCEEMRKQEGESLRADLQKRIGAFVADIARIEIIVPTLVEKREQSLRQRLEKLLANVDLDPLRLSQEVAIMADKTDVTEELVRLRSHIDQFERFLKENGSVGRKLDFLIQEFLREVNTLGSKINDAETAHLTVDLKSELEKIREQVQNIE
ncbi:YicC/YloC family endoribonuclease [Desulfopila inferna]|uniref:YicC/YloC family endoribonuclease n=1 Tax=Desulfopila inferna TaxID=468528 RepID=UPI0019654F95|nr:YicC/YloC family endoribonuclease [Desulfopila inferna]MBM9605229.1 YicC family protein [Desulfopila inferna]